MSDMNFDERCYELAEYFYPDAPETGLNRLASRIQWTGESYACRHNLEKLCTCYDEPGTVLDCPYETRPNHPEHSVR